MSNKQKHKHHDKQYVLVWVIQHTLLEKYILEVIKKSPNGGCSDLEIAEALTLTPEEVAYIIDDKSPQRLKHSETSWKSLKRFIQGDVSRRTIAGDFTGLEWNIVKSSKPEKEHHEFPENELLPQEKIEKLCDSSRYIKKEYNQVPKRLKKLKAKEYYLIVSKNDGEDGA